jgi:CheY-like chemotaxis protein
VLPTVAARHEAAQDAHNAGISLPAKRVLVIDDNADARKSIKIILELARFQVSVAANGREALEIQRQCRIDIVLTDLFMPEMDGIETIQQLRQNDPHIQIAAISGAEPSMLERLSVVIRELGVTQVLRKPVDPPTILAVVRDLARAGTT